MQKAKELFLAFSLGGYKVMAFIVMAIIHVLGAVVIALDALYHYIGFSRIMRILIWWAYFKEQNNFYGWNVKPSNEMELLTDGIHALLFCLIFLPSGKSGKTIKVTVNGVE